MISLKLTSFGSTGNHNISLPHEPQIGLLTILSIGMRFFVAQKGQARIMGHFLSCKMLMSCLAMISSSLVGITSVLTLLSLELTIW
ncbi:hypothetical protein M2126_000775 [Polynucleobacter sphagniphilus]|uniref:Uncharacterized protein n=1 Tax=Polynucleobacter sphagniphilus TaxID=1743169 RepID=A0AA43S5F4_9BURK|nr:hypothetical protein [Polynucleobacter sphagniphilus]MDH6512147.1 hypothetical protein [Polynucleobacter sphagniphilus]